MRTAALKNANVAPGISALILGGLITFGLFILRFFDILQIDKEVVIAPFVVISLLSFGDKLLLGLLLLPIRFFLKFNSRLK